MKFAIINHNQVINIIVADSLEIAQSVNPNFLCVEYTDENPVGIGWLWDGTTFTNPFIVEEPIVEDSVIEESVE